MTITTVFAIRYCNLLRMAQKEYEKVKDIISTIIFTFKRNQDKQNETIHTLALRLVDMRSDIEKSTNHLQRMESKFKVSLTTGQPVPLVSQETRDYVNLIKKDVDSIAQNQLKIKNRLNILEEKLQTRDRDEKSITSINHNQPLSKLTETEYIIFEFLKTEGAKTAPEVEEKIGKTREHTARLMKKLWQNGYIERETHRIPYIYHINESLKKMKVSS